MSPFFAALPPADLPTMAYEPPGLHAAQLLTARSAERHTVRSGDTVYDIAAQYRVSPQAVVRANRLKDGGHWIMPGQVLTIPGADGSTSDRPKAARSSGGTVTVRAGDTLSGVALRSGTTVAALVRANDIPDPRLIYPGQRLTVPGTSSAPSAPSTGKESPTDKKSPTAGAGTYTVRPGDTLSGIAARHGTTVAALTRANDISAAAHIHPGQRLRVPGAAAPAGSTPRTAPYDEHNIGDYKKGEKVPDTFLHYRYSDGIARSAAANREYLAGVSVPSAARMKEIIVATSNRYGVDPKLMLALSYQESGWNHRAVSPANAIGVMQVIPSSGQWASGLVGRNLNLLDPHDNVEAGVVIMRALQNSTDNKDHAIGGYYQGLGSVRQHGLFPDTERYVSNIKALAKTM